MICIKKFSEGDERQGFFILLIYRQINVLCTFQKFQISDGCTQQNGLRLSVDLPRCTYQWITVHLSLVSPKNSWDQWTFLMRIHTQNRGITLIDAIYTCWNRTFNINRTQFQCTSITIWKFLKVFFSFQHDGCITWQCSPDVDVCQERKNLINTWIKNTPCSV